MSRLSHFNDRARLNSPLVIFVAIVIATLARGPAESFVFDAASYWDASVGLARGDLHHGQWTSRGVFTSLVYLPAASLAMLTRMRHSGLLVLAQNALILGWAAAFLVPRVVGRWREVSVAARWGCAGLAWFTLSGLAPYPLMDLCATVALLAVVALQPVRHPAALLASGLLAGFAVNIRPAHLIILGAILILTPVRRGLPGLLTWCGTALALLPQLILNVWRFGSWLPWPISTAEISALQTGYAAYIVRYDTLSQAVVPQQFFCSPGMAQVAVDAPRTAGELAQIFLAHFPAAAVFSLEKIAASLHWPVSTPYLVPAPGWDTLHAMVVTSVTVAGIAWLCGTAVRNSAGSPKWHDEDWQLIAAIGLGTLITIVASTPETRFSLPLVLLGIIGCTALVDASRRMDWGRAPSRIFGAIVVLCIAAAGVLSFGGLSHPAAPGPVTAAVCAQAPGFR